MPSQVTLQTASGASLIEYIIAGNQAAGGESIVSIFNVGDESGDFGVGTSQALTCTAPQNILVGDIIFFSVSAFQFPPGGAIPSITGVSDDLGSSNIWLSLPVQTFLNDHLPATTEKFQIFYSVVTTPVANGTVFHLTANYSASCGTQCLDSVVIRNITVLDQLAQQTYTTPTSAVIGPLTTTVDECLIWFVGVSGPNSPAPSPGTWIPFFPLNDSAGMFVANSGINFNSPPGTYTLTSNMTFTGHNAITFATFKILGA